MDNGIFSGKFSPRDFWNKLNQMKPYQSTCLFIVAPDTVSDAYATMCAFSEWQPLIKAAGWPVALVAQDDMEWFPFPSEFDALFVGGSTEWKMSKEALRCIKRAKNAGKWVHVGRVNSQKRIRHFQLAGVDSVDGTTVCFSPNKSYSVIDRQLAQRPLLRVEV